MVLTHEVFKPLPSAHLEERASAAVSGCCPGQGSATQMLPRSEPRTSLEKLLQVLGFHLRQFCDGSRKDAAEED